MKKIVSLFLALLLCVCLVTAALYASGAIVKKDPDPDPKPTVSFVLPGDPDGTNTVPPAIDKVDTE